MKKILNIIFSELGRIITGALLFCSAFAFDYVDRIYSFSVRSFLLYAAALLVAGLPVFYGAVKGLLRRDLLDEKFLMSLASVGAFVISEYREGVAVMLFFLVGEYFEHRAVNKSRNSIRKLMDIKPDEATVIVDGEEAVFDAEDVEIGSIIIIRAGERVPIDSVVVSGSADVDTSAISGESIPVSVCVGDSLSSGCVVLDGLLTAKTVRASEDSAAARILQLVENANERKSRAENFITVFSRFYTPIVVSLALVIAVIPPIFSFIGWSESVYRALSFLVISCPCALVISVPLAFFGGIGAAASKGILFKGGNVFSALANADSFVFDKTGTLTTGQFSVAEISAVGVSEEELLFLAASAEYASNHPIAECIKKSAKSYTAPESAKEVAGRGVAARVFGADILVGNIDFLALNSISVNATYATYGAVYVSKNGEFIGSIKIRDSIKKEAPFAISTLTKRGKRVVMLSGDRRENAESVGRDVGIEEVYAELLPDDKYSYLQKIISESQGTVFVGDGINDAPSIALADVGVAMGAVGQDSAIEAADVVLMTDNLDKLPVAISIAKRSVRISKENIIFAIGVKLLILILSAIGIANMWLAVFADVGVAAIAILNSMRTLR